MGKALIIGCGGVASVAIHKCCQNSEVFEEICIASRTVSKCDALKEKLQGTTKTKITTAQVNADNVEELIELINKHQIETQEELAAYLNQEGFKVTQATVSRDIRDLKLTKVPAEDGKQFYAVHQSGDGEMGEKYIRVLREGFLSMDMAQNILVIKTVTGMANAVCVAIDAMNWPEVNQVRVVMWERSVF